jgi:hypothetical protein
MLFVELVGMLFAEHAEIVGVLFWCNGRIDNKPEVELD